MQPLIGRRAVVALGFQPVSRAGRLNISRNELVMLPSARAIDRCSSGMNVNGSGMGLEYFRACR